jgi:hypothetical protein
MKKLVLPIITLLIGFALGYFVFNHKQSDGTTNLIDPENKGLTIADVNRIFKISRSDQVVCHNFADSCAKHFCDIYKNGSFNAHDLKKLKTTSVNFGTRSLLDWLNDIAANTDADSIKIKLGIYDNRIINAFPTQLSSKLDRLTAFLYATKFDPTKKHAFRAVFTKPSTYQQTTPSGCLSTTTFTIAAVGDSTEAFNFAGIEP